MLPVVAGSPGALQYGPAAFLLFHQKRVAAFRALLVVGFSPADEIAHLAGTFVIYLALGRFFFQNLPRPADRALH